MINEEARDAHRVRINLNRRRQSRDGKQCTVGRRMVQLKPELDNEAQSITFGPYLILLTMIDRET